MKKIITGVAILLIAFVMLPSCQKEVVQKEVVKEITIDTTISAGANYYLELAPYGDEGDAAHIIETPSFASTSVFENETDMFTYIYHYTAASDAAGRTDHVTIAVSRTACADSTIIYLNLSIK
jgi:hypothetical protein